MTTPWPSTTQLLRRFGLMADYEQFGHSNGNSGALERGRLVHAACHMIGARKAHDAVVYPTCE
jgi:hypothetical protein